MSRFSLSHFIIFTTLASVLTVPIMSYGQSQSQKQDEIIRLETELVQLDVVVIGKDGKPVRNLPRESFQLLEDGKVQQITHFATGTAENPASWLSRKKTANSATGSPAETSDAGIGRYFVFAVDDFHIRADNLMNAKRVLKQFIRDQMVPGDQIALINTSGSIGLFQQFTDDREVLNRAVDRLSVQTRTASSHMDIPKISEYQAELIETGDPDALQLAVEELKREMPPMASSGGGGGGRGPSMSSSASTDSYVSQVRTRARMIVAQASNYTRATLATLESVIRTLDKLQGRKIMVLISDGFFLNHGTGDSRVYDIRRITDAATRGGVTIYSLDSRGLDTGMDISQSSSPIMNMPGVRERINSAAMMAARDGIGIIADETGGFLVKNTNDLNAGLQRVLDHNDSYYVLAYEPELSRKNGQFHKIDVRIIDRKDLTVRTRKGYFSSLNDLFEIAENKKKKNKDKSPPQTRKQ